MHTSLRLTTTYGFCLWSLAIANDERQGTNTEAKTPLFSLWHSPRKWGAHPNKIAKMSVISISMCFLLSLHKCVPRIWTPCVEQSSLDAFGITCGQRHGFVTRLQSSELVFLASRIVAGELAIEIVVTASRAETWLTNQT